VSALQDRFSIEVWLADVRECVIEQSPDLLDILDVYLEEARFGRRYIAPDLRRLPLGAAVLEVGAGLFLLSCQLVREGFNVTALEPTGDGFSHFGRLRQVVLTRAKLHGYLPRVLDEPAEALSDRCSFDYAFSVNVMEHVEDVARTLANVGASLKLGATYRFTCPNYLFPYEPHFNIPTLFSKGLTEKLLGAQILRNKGMPDPEGTWRSLNWIDVRKIRKTVRCLPDCSVSFKRNVLVSTLERIAFDKEFAMRRSNWARAGILALVRLRLHRLAWLIPALLQPVIDCEVTRGKVKEAL
jgi:SAM-dependent methyltransferase